MNLAEHNRVRVWFPQESANRWTHYALKPIDPSCGLDEVDAQRQLAPLLQSC